MPDSGSPMATIATAFCSRPSQPGASANRYLELESSPRPHKFAGTTSLTCGRGEARFARRLSLLTRNLLPVRKRALLGAPRVGDQVRDALPPLHQSFQHALELILFAGNPFWRHL